MAAQYVQRARNCGPCRARWMKCIHNGVEDTRAAFVVYEYLGPTNIKEYGDLIKAGDKDTRVLTTADVLRITKELLEGLALVQGMYVHRDIKAENVMIVDSDGKVNVWLIDVGLVCEVGDTKATSPSGTPPTLAPEGFVTTYVPRSSFDIYSLGAMLYELLCGRYLFDYMWESVSRTSPHIAHDQNAMLQKVFQQLRMGPSGKSFCNVEGELKPLFDLVTSKMLVIEGARSDAITLLKDAIFADVDTSGGALTEAEPFEALNGEKLPQEVEQPSVPVQLLRPPVVRLAPIVVVHPPVVVRRIVYQTPVITYKS